MATLYGAQKYYHHQHIFNTEMEFRNLEKNKLSKMFDLVTDKINVCHFYNSNNALHDEFNREASLKIREAANKACAEVVSIDISELDAEDSNLLFHITGKTKEEIMWMHSPLIVLKSNCSFKTIDNQLVWDQEELRKFIKNQSQSHHINSLNEFANVLKENKSLND